MAWPGSSADRAPQPCLTAAPGATPGISKRWSVPSPAIRPMWCIAGSSQGPTAGSAAIAAYRRTMPVAPMWVLPQTPARSLGRPSENTAKAAAGMRHPAMSGG